MKKYFSIAVIIAALMLSACSGSSTSSVTDSQETSQTEQSSQVTQDEQNEQDGQNEQTEQTTQSSQESSDASSETVSESSDSEQSTPDGGTSFILYGPGGDVVSSDEFSRVDTLNDAQGVITADNWRQASIYGFTYMAEPGSEYKRVKTGDNILGFTVGETECTFTNDETPERIGSEGAFSSGYAELEGNVTLNGTIHAATEDGFSYSAGDLLFVPDEDSRVLPVMNYSYSSDAGVYTKVDESGNMYPDIIITAGSFVDTSVIPTDGTPVHVLITLEKISMSSSIDVSSNMRAEIVAFEIK